MTLKYKHTALACYGGMISQAIVNNLAPLLFIIFKNQFGVTDEQLGRLILFNFSTQLFADVLAAKFVDRIGYRVSALIAHGLCALGLMCMGVLPMLMADAYAGLCIAAVVYALGGGIIEVIISPITESLPGEEKAKAMSLAHSFYCWGQLMVVLLTTLSLWAFGQRIWRALPIVWALIPLVNLMLFMKVPLKPTVSEEARTPFRKLLSNRAFVIGLIMMVCAGSGELSMAQWSSLFVETTLGVSKLVGDLLGPCLFALFMALGRTAYGLYGERIDLGRALVLSGALCVVCYITAVFIPALSLIGCALCGLSVALMWPGTLSMTARVFPLGGTAMFGAFAVCGDMGCSLGPWLAGLVSDITQGSATARAFADAQSIGIDALGLRVGLFVVTLFPLGLFISALFMRKYIGNKKTETRE